VISRSTLSHAGHTAVAARTVLPPRYYLTITAAVVDTQLLQSPSVGGRIIIIIIIIIIHIAVVSDVEYRPSVVRRVAARAG